MTMILGYCDECKQMTNHEVWRGYVSCLKCRSEVKEKKE